MHAFVDVGLALLLGSCSLLRVCLRRGVANMGFALRLDFGVGLLCSLLCVCLVLFLQTAQASPVLGNVGLIHKMGVGFHLTSREVRKELRIPPSQKRALIPLGTHGIWSECAMRVLCVFGGDK